MSSKILVVEDDQTLLGVLKYNFVKEGYHVVTATDGAQALKTARKDKPDLIILDIMLPEMSGYEVCRILRKEMNVPIVVLTARDDETDKVTGLDLGADDYITKPFSMRELLARVRALLRRLEMQIPQSGTELFRIANITVDLARHTVLKDGIPVILTPKEFDLLAFLTQNNGFVFSRQQLLEKIWGYDFPGDTRTVDVHVRWLREKIEDDPGKPAHLLTVRGTGYKMEGASDP
jgi:two-component system OmpR family response regulator